MPTPLIRLLHLSDLHFGPHSRFQGEDHSSLGKSFHQALAEATKNLGIESRVDLVIVTGDVAESGKPKEFELGAQFLRALAGEIGLEYRKFVFVPGTTTSPGRPARKWRRTRKSKASRKTSSGRG